MIINRLRTTARCESLGPDMLGYTTTQVEAKAAPDNVPYRSSAEVIACAIEDE